jgi:dinuclear metal center YbgI/SA1388 family protein
MKLSDLITSLEELAPPSYQESYDNSGLITGNPEMEITGALICLDSIEAVLDEAIAKGCNLIVAHHPIVFSGLKRFTGKTYIERVLIKALKNDLAIYAIHTNLDNISNGVNAEIGRRLGLTNTSILQPMKGKLRKLSTFVPLSHVEIVREGLFASGAGNIGNYSACSFVSEGTGTFMGNEASNPVVGSKGVVHTEKEVKIEVVFEARLENAVLQKLHECHPYEEIAYFLHTLDNSYQNVGAGLIGTLEQGLSAREFLEQLKTKMKTPVVRYTSPVKELIRTVAVCGGSGSFLLPTAIAAKADVFVTADFKYHQFFDADGKIMIADIGHFESEQFTIDLLSVYLCEKFPKFAVHLTEINTNPINYI